MIRYPSLASVLVQQRLRQQALAEELRVLYVAMTRAREHLVLIGTCDADAPAGWSNKWASHVGPFPGDMILSAKCLLDWLGPTAAGAGDQVLQIIPHSAEEVAAWQTSHGKRPTLSPQQTGLAELRPIEPVPVVTEAARRVIDRLEFEYPFASFAALPAVEAVTARRSERGSMANGRDLARPRFLAGKVLSPADVGSATHLVLTHLDFAVDDLDGQIDSMVARKLVSMEQAAAVDRDSIRWLLSSEIGELLKANAAHLRREVPVHFAALATNHPESSDPQDRIMVRGRIDLLVSGKGGVTLIDYKTDNVSAEHAPDRAKGYAEQLSQYRTAMEQITGTPVEATYLVFLKPRVVL
jgi:ATP-dependent helicase/nuclease subunit A